MKRRLNALISGLSVKSKMTLLNHILVIPLFLIISIALLFLGNRVQNTLDDNMKRSRDSVANALQFFRKETTTYAGMISGHYDIRRGTYFNNTGMILKYVTPILKETQLDLIIVHDRNSVILARAHMPEDFNIDDKGNNAVEMALDGKINKAIEMHGDDIIIRTTVPVYHATSPGFIVGTVTVGYKLNNHFAEMLKNVSGTEVLFAYKNTILASSFGKKITYPFPLHTGSDVVDINGTDYDVGAVSSKVSTPESFQVYAAINNSVFKKTFRRIFIGAVFLFLALAAGMLFISSKIGGNITASTEKIIKSTDEIAHQNYNIDIQTGTRDEFNTLALRFNAMARSIHGNIRTIKNQSHEIEILKNFLSNIIESMPAVLIAVDEHGIITQWNHAAAEFTKIPVEKAIGRILWDLVPFLSKYEQYYKEIIDKKESKLFHREVFGEDEIRYYDVSLFPLIEGSSNGMVIRAEDVTEIENKEEQLRQAQKMEVVGRLAGGLAHDFNNVLGGVTGALSIIKHRVNKKQQLNPDELMELIEIIGESTERSVDIVQQLLSLSRKTVLTFSPVDLNTCVSRVIKICGNTFDKSIELNPVYTHEKAMANADATQLEQVLLNLCVNASHAMTIMKPEGAPQGGLLTVRVDIVQPDSVFCDTHPGAQQIDYWVVSVEDNGVGMDKKTAAKIFDPFFSTKPKHKGSGLGLSMVYNIVQRHNGFLDLVSEPGAGTIFNIYLPILYGNHLPIQTSKMDENLHYGEGLILIVDDEALMQHTTKKILVECGYTAITASNGIEGTRIFEQLHKEIKAVLLDMMMPKMAGKEAFIRMKAIQPDVKVLLISGFKQNQQITELLDMGIMGFLPKPFTAMELSEAIWRITEKNSGA